MSGKQRVMARGSSILRTPACRRSVSKASASGFKVWTALGEVAGRRKLDRKRILSRRGFDVQLRVVDDRDRTVGACWHPARSSRVRAITPQGRATRRRNVKSSTPGPVVE